MAVKISDTDGNADWIKWRTDDTLGEPEGEADQDFLGVVRGEEPEEAPHPFSEVVRKYKRRAQRR